MNTQQSIKNLIRASIASFVTEELADSLLDEYEEIVNRFDLGDFRPSELNGARFAEAAFRICQHVCTGNYSPIGTSLPRVDQLLRNLEQTPNSTADDSFRLHIPRALRLIYDLRNRRDVAHLGSGISPNFSDASIVLGCASWVLAEIVRICHQCDIDTAQRIVDNLPQRRTSLIWTEGDIVRVLNPELSYKEQVLLILHHLQPNWVDERQLFEWVGYSNISTFRDRVLNKLHDDALIHYRNGRTRILPPGNSYVEHEIKARHLLSQ